MTVGIAPDIEVIVKDFLRGQAAVQALNTRFVSEHPKEGDRDQSWVLVADLADPGDNIDHLIEFMVQLDFYAGKDDGTPQLKTLVRIVRSALRGINTATHASGVVVTGYEWHGGPRGWDPEMKPPRRRWPCTVTFWAHG